MDINSDPFIEFLALSYETEQEKELHLRKVTETTSNMRSQDSNNEASSIQTNHVGHVFQTETCSEVSCDDDDNIINIQIPYDPNIPTESELWSGNFHSISLHNSIEHIASDTKSIKDSLNFMVKYIANKKVNPKIANDLKNFNGISDSVWNFISLVY